MLKVYVDAATKGNPGPSGGGIVIDGENIHEQLHVELGELTNHEAEFKIINTALQKIIAQKRNNQTVLLHSDSKTAVQTIDKNYTGNTAFQPYLEEFHQLERQFPLLLIQWIPESQNKGADNLARQALRKFFK